MNPTILEEASLGRSESSAPFFAGQEAVLLDPDQVIQGITHYGAPKRMHFQTR